MNISKLKIGGALVCGSLATYHCLYSPLRALCLTPKAKAEIKSIRDSDVKWIREKIDVSRPEYNRFSVVRGPRGIGKSVAVDWATNDMRGVVTTPEISPGKSKDEILNIVFNKITGLKGTWSENEGSMVRVIYFYRIFTGRAPIVVLSADQRELGQQPAALTEAARTLVNRYGLVVLIDCAENSFPSELSGREMILDMEPMSNEMLRKLSEFEDVFKVIKDQGNEDVIMRLIVWLVLLE